MKDVPYQPAVLSAADILIAPENPRSNDTVDLAKVRDLASNILEHGVLTPLIGYMEDDRFYAVAGGRRTRAIDMLVRSEEMSPDTPIPVRIIDKASAGTIGIAEQVTHQELSDLDEMRIYAHPEYSDKSDAELARIIGKSAKAVQQRRAVLSLPEDALAAMWDGKITVEQAHGLTYFLGDDDSIAELVDECIRNPRTSLKDLRDDFKRQCTEWDRDPRTKLFTIAEYIEAGGKMQDDLFTDAMFILSPGVVEALAKDHAPAEMMKRYPDAPFILNLDELDHTPRRFWGIDSLTYEERDEWDEIRWDKWSKNEDEEPEWFERYRELEAKAELVIPDDAAPYLGVGYTIRRYGDDPLQVTDKLLPIRQDVLEFFYDKGYLERPEEREVPFEDGGETEREPDPLQLSNAMLDRIRRIRIQVARNELVKKPDLAMAHYIVHVQKPYSTDFTYTPENSNMLTAELMADFDDGPKWKEAKALIDTEPEQVFNLKPAQIKSLMAFRILDCMGNADVAFTFDDKVRSYWTPSDDFCKGYTKPQLLHMLKDCEGNFDSMKKGTLAELVAEHAENNAEFLPLGF